MNKVVEAAVELEEFCRRCGWRFCFIGGLAVLRWGEVRITRDADVTLITGWGREDDYSAPLLQKYAARVANPANFARTHRVLLLEATNGTPLDIAFGAMDFEVRASERASEFEIIAGHRITICGAEDLVVYKAFANRDRDWVDIRGILDRQQGRLDSDLIFKELEPLAELKGEPKIIDRLKRVLS